MNKEKSEKVKKWQNLRDKELQKELDVLQNEILLLRIDIANRKTKGIHRIRSHKKDVARIKTIISMHKEHNE